MERIKEREEVQSPQRINISPHISCTPNQNSKLLQGQ